MNLKNRILPLLLLLVFVFAACDKEYDTIDAADAKAVNDYIKKNNLDVQEYNNTGIFYKVTKPGTGPVMEFSDQVAILYSIRTTDGSVSTVDTFSNRVFTYLAYINPEGLRTGIKEVLKNSNGEIRLIIPSRLGYGRNGTAVFPGNVSIDITASVVNKESMPRYDDFVIKKFLQDKGLTGFTKTSTGLYYKVLEPGTGLQVVPESRIITTYNGKLLNGKTFDSSTAYNSLLEDLIEGWREGLLQIKEGGKIRLLVPSALAYGFAGSGPIPPFSCLDFEIQVTKVFP